MPHFIVDCSADIVKKVSPYRIIKCIYDCAKDSKLFTEGDIKVRIVPYNHYTVANTQDDFIHVLAHIMAGRTPSQKYDLSRDIVKKLIEIFPDCPVISMDVRDIDKSCYNNRDSVS